MFEILGPAGAEIIKHNYIIPFFQKSIHQVAADKAGATSDEGRFINQLWYSWKLKKA